MKRRISLHLTGKTAGELIAVAQEAEAAGVEILRPDKALFARQVEELIDRYAADEEVGGWIRRIQATNVSPAEEAQ